MDVLDMAQERRCVKATMSYAESSRSHMVFTIHFKVEPRMELVDLESSLFAISSKQEKLNRVELQAASNFSC